MMQQMATLNDEQVVLERMHRQDQDLIVLGKRSMWCRFLFCSVVAVCHADRLLVFRLAAKFSKTLSIMLHNLWLSGCSLIHTKLSFEVEIGKLNDVREEM